MVPLREVALKEIEEKIVEDAVGTGLRPLSHRWSLGERALD
jgi:hypothetical protein